MPEDAAPARGASTSRFMAHWILGLLPVSITWGFLQHFLLPKLYSGGTFSTYVLPSALGILFACAGAAIQSELLARHRRFLPRWMLATVLGSLAGTLLSTIGSFRLMSAAPRSEAMAWISSIAWNTTYALAIAVAQGLVLWGRRWTPEWPLWAAGMLLVRVVPILGISMGLRQLAEAGPATAASWWWLLNAPLQGALSAAGTAWLLDRLYFRPDVEIQEPAKAAG